MTAASSGGFLRDQAYQRLRLAILGGTYPPGTKLVMDDLAAEFGLSQTPVREAVARLVTEGVVVRRSRSAHVVRSHSEREARDLVQVQTLLVLETYRLTLPLLTDRDVAELRALNDRVVRARSQAALAERLDAFYAAVYDRCPNPELTALRVHLRDRVLMAMREHWSAEMTRIGNDVHDLMLSRIEAGDPDGALRAMVEGWSDFTRTIGIDR